MQTPSSTFLFDPKSPLVFRTGKPFDQAGDPESLDFPLPSTMAGACRTVIGDQNSWNFKEKSSVLKEIAVHGPLAAEIGEDSTVTPLFPRPGDCLYFQDENKQVAPFRLQPGEPEEGGLCDLPTDLLPVFLEQDIRSKPIRGDNWWYPEPMFEWLEGKKPVKRKPDQLGWHGPVRDLRTHVALKPNSLAADSGKLFQTEGLSFGQNRIAPNDHHGWKTTRYGLLAHLPGHHMKEDFRRIGGEGRLSFMQESQESWPAIPASLVARLDSASCIRLILATPALFEHGWRPKWIENDLQGSPPGFPEVVLRLRAFAAGRWQPVSGWDLQTRGPRAVRRMVPAGAVYWFEVLQGREHIQKLWLQPVSDHEQDRLDGYGIVLPGIWEKK